MGSTHGTITNQDDQFFWDVGNTFSLITKTNGANISSPNFYFENECWQFVLEKTTPVGEPPNIARDSFLLKLTNHTRNSKSVFHVQLSVAYQLRIFTYPRSSLRNFEIESEICKLDSRVKTAEYEFNPFNIFGNWSKISGTILAFQATGKTPVDSSQWKFSCQFFTSGTPEKKETSPTIKEVASWAGYQNNSQRTKQLPWKVKSAEKLQEDFKKLLIGGKNSDVVIKVEGREFQAHRSILSARSDYFSAMFDHDTSEKRTGVVTIEDCDPDAFECLLQYIYTGEACFSPVPAIGLYTVADRCQVLELKEECARQIKSSLSVDSFCDVARMSLLYPEMNLTEIISPYFTKNASDIVSTSEWETFMGENPKLCNKLLCSTLKPTPNTPLHRPSQGPS